MQMVLSSYSTNNLTRAAEFLLDLTKSLNEEMTNLHKLKDDVTQQQQETHKQGQLVKKMTNYLSDELGRLEISPSNSSVLIGNNIEKLTETETKLRILRGRLNDFVENDDADNLKKSDFSIANDLKRYESFLLQLTNTLNEKIPQLEKIIDRIKAESREAQQQRLLLKEIIDLFNDELVELDSAFCELRGKTSVS
jgi:CII-binding regulator of phage lambda lysogenization HflD